MACVVAPLISSVPLAVAVIVFVAEHDPLSSTITSCDPAE
jgi:hypothetical protein